MKREKEKEKGGFVIRRTPFLLLEADIGYPQFFEFSSNRELS